MWLELALLRLSTFYLPLHETAMTLSCVELQKRDFAERFAEPARRVLELDGTNRVFRTRSRQTTEKRPAVAAGFQNPRELDRGRFD